MTLVEFFLLVGLFLLVTILRRLDLIYEAIEEARGATGAILDIVDPDSQDVTVPNKQSEPQPKPVSQERIYPEI